jgi:hypothetical protein
MVELNSRLTLVTGFRKARQKGPGEARERTNGGGWTHAGLQACRQVSLNLVLTLSGVPGQPSDRSYSVRAHGMPQLQWAFRPNNVSVTRQSWLTGAQGGKVLYARQQELQAG